jgi:hypothetical protein
MCSMMKTRLRRAGSALAVAAACAGLPAAPALASADQQSVIEDEHQMLELGPAAQTAALDDAKALGADVIRANVIWGRYAPSPNSRRKPKGFDGKDPNAYGTAFGPLDGLVASAQARGLQVLLTATGPTPAWASRCGGSVKNRRTCKPDPKLFGAFVRALGKRYPTVKLWSIWNEPNLRAWLTPQYVGTTLQSPALYRALAASAIAGLRGTGHRADQILLGETAPIGQRPGPRANANPEPFLRGLFCLKADGKRLTGAAGAAQRCSHYKKLSVTGYAHHPYTRGGSQPPLVRTGAGEITIAVASRLTRLLDQAGRAKRVPAKLPVFYTENGWQTNPPDRIFGVLPDFQAAYINEADWIAYKNPRIKAVAQYKLIDDADPASFQSGVRLSDGSKKPSYAAYQLPIWVAKKGAANVTVYGQVRPADDGAALQVEVQHAASSGAAFQTVQTVPVTSLKGQFIVELPNQGGGVWRLRANGLTSRQAGVGT